MFVTIASLVRTFTFAASLAPSPPAPDRDALPRFPWDPIDLADQETPLPKDTLTPARQPASSGDVLDFGKTELDGSLTALVFSSRFHANTDFGFTALAHCPSPWFSRDVLGLDHDDFGAFVQLSIGHIRRTLTNLEDRSGLLVFATIGADYAIYRDAEWMATAQIGLQYGYFGGVTDLHNGFALMIGVEGGYQVADRIWITLNPQLTFGERSDMIFFINLGVNFQF